MPVEVRFSSDQFVIDSAERSASVMGRRPRGDGMASFCHTADKISPASFAQIKGRFRACYGGAARAPVTRQDDGVLEGAWPLCRRSEFDVPDGRHRFALLSVGGMTSFPTHVPAARSYDIVRQIGAKQPDPCWHRRETNSCMRADRGYAVDALALGYGTRGTSYRFNRGAALPSRPGHHRQAVTMLWARSAGCEPAYAAPESQYPPRPSFV